MKIKLGKTTCYFKGVEENSEKHKLLTSQASWETIKSGDTHIVKPVCVGVYYWDEEPNPCVVLQTRERCYLVKSKNVCNFSENHDIFMITLTSDGGRNKYVCTEQGKIDKTGWEDVTPNA